MAEEQVNETAQETKASKEWNSEIKDLGEKAEPLRELVRFSVRRTV